jgi:predicted phage terminase large subunit-like protein
LQELKPQPGPQTDFLSTSADIAIYGGAAGGGKSFALLLEALRHTQNGQFGAVIFRRDRQQVTNEGGLWDESAEMFAPLGAEPNASSLSWTFPSGSSISFAGLQRRDDVYKWQGSQIALLEFDELTHFDEFQFWYMVGRNRSTSGVKPYVRAGCNPDADSWVAKLVSYWIDQDTGFPIPERAGVLRYLVRDADRNHWFDDREDAVEAFPHLAAIYAERGLDATAFCKSVTFIPADVFDNKILLEKNPEYLANLLAQPLIERERLLRGNWKVRASAGKVFNREWFRVVYNVPKGGIYVRFWDLAATEKSIRTTSKKNDPDYTATVKMHYDPKAERWTVVDAFQVRASPAAVEKLVYQTALIDRGVARQMKARYKLRWEIEPGSASIRENARWIKAFKGFDAKGVTTGGQDKITRGRAHSVQAESGNVDILLADWNEMFLGQMHGFPDLAHDDVFDAANGAFNATIARGQVVFG